MSTSRLSSRLPLSMLLQQPTRCYAQSGVRGITHSAQLLSQAPVFASGVDKGSLQALVDDLVKPTGQWALSASGRGIERTYKFKSFKAAWSFMSSVAEKCKSARHHPEWSNVYDSVFVRWTTHNPPGLTNKDAEMAGLCDRLAITGEGGEAGTTAQGKDTEKLKDLTDGAANKSGGQPEKEQARQAEKEKIEKEEEEEGAQGSVAGIGGQPT